MTTDTPPSSSVNRGPELEQAPIDSVVRGDEGRTVVCGARGVRTVTFKDAAGECAGVQGHEGFVQHAGLASKAIVS